MRRNKQDETRRDEMGTYVHTHKSNRTKRDPEKTGLQATFRARRKRIENALTELEAMAIDVEEVNVSRGQVDSRLLEGGVGSGLAEFGDSG